jgi:hypothetical protein
MEGVGLIKVPRQAKEHSSFLEKSKISMTRALAEEGIKGQ